MSIQGSGEHPTFPAQWLYGLLRALPGEPCTVATVACAHSSIGPMRYRQAWRQHWGVRTTRLRRTRHAVRFSAHPRPPQLIPTSEAIAIRPSWRGWDGKGYSKYFWI